MKNRRSLKKRIKKSFDTLYQEIIFYEVFAAKPDSEATKTILDKIINTEYDLISRISIYEGKEVKGRIQSYFQKLEEDYKNRVDEITKEIAALS